MKLEWRGTVRPAYVPSAQWRRRPIGVLSHRYRDPDEGTWSWTCRLECWAALTSGWYLRTQREALGEGVEHLRTYHFPVPCTRRGLGSMPEDCTERHVNWAWQFPDGIIKVTSHLREWLPVPPLLHEHVTQGDISAWRAMIAAALHGDPVAT